MKKFAVFDIDGTLLRWQLYHAVADELGKLGHFDDKAYEEVREARMVWKKRESEDSFKEYERKLVELVDSAMTGISAADLNSAATKVMDEYKNQVYTYTRDLIRDLRSQNYLLFAISASQIQLVEMMAEYYGFDDFGGSVYEIKNGYFTGKKDVLKSERKPEYLKTLVDKYGASYEGSIAVGDSESDIPMLDVVSRPIAFNPTRKLFDHARKNGWQIVIERKNVIYELEGDNGKYLLA